MYPELFRIGPLPVYSYGLMLGISFIVGSYFLTKEFKRAGISENIASEITLLCIILGVAGSKMFHLFENWSEFVSNPLGMIFSPSGLTYYGGFLLTTAGVAIYLRKKKLGFLRVVDLVSPALALSYGIGRIGCHLAGDGDYGIPTSLPWGMSYSNGVVKPSMMFFGSKYAEKFPNGIMPDDLPLHPTPLYEFFGAVIIFIVLWQLRTKFKIQGQMFAAYLVLTGTARLLVEFLRLNPTIFMGLTEAQLISVSVIVAGIVLWYYSKKEIPQLSKNINTVKGKISK